MTSHDVHGAFKLFSALEARKANFIIFGCHMTNACTCARTRDEERACVLTRQPCACHVQAGRVILAGDAAHCFPPAGGFGMNTGIQVHSSSRAMCMPWMLKT